MSEQTTHLLRRKARFSWDPKFLMACGIAAIVVFPIISVLYLAFFPETNIWPHLIATTLPRYVSNTLILMLSVGAVTIAVGAGAAWVIVMHDFPGKRWLQWALLLPLAVPAYVGAYALVDFLEYAGPVQTLLRAHFGWQSARDYWFPEIRSKGAAVIVLSAALYPYVYLLTRAALREQSAAGYDVARALGAGPFARFRRIGFPLTRPAIAAGAAVVMMETVNDFGTVDYFAVQTLTTGIFSLWQQSGNVGGAAQIAVLVLAMVFFMVGTERISRRRSRFYGSARSAGRPVAATRLRGVAALGATIICALPVMIGFVLPVAVLLSHAVHAEAWIQPGLIRAMVNTVVTGGLAALICVFGAVMLIFGVRREGNKVPAGLLPVTAMGYAVPGAVLGLGILIPLAALNNWLADVVLAATGWDPGLFLTGSAFAVVLSYCVRFFAIAQGAVDGAWGRISPSLPMAARSLGLDSGQTLRRVHRPLMRATLGSAVLLVFVDSVKELPATLMLRPFGYETLATRVHAKASLENIADTAPAALAICLVGLIAVTLLAKANR